MRRSYRYHEMTEDKGASIAFLSRESYPYLKDSASRIQILLPVNTMRLIGLRTSYYTRQITSISQIISLFIRTVLTQVLSGELARLLLVDAFPYTPRRKYRFGAAG